jgi:hypothetical protein
MSALYHWIMHNSKIIFAYVWLMCYDVQNFDFSKGNSSFLELSQVILTLVTIAKILYYHQGIFLYIEACVKTKKMKNQNYFKRPSQQLCPGQHWWSKSMTFIFCQCTYCLDHQCCPGHSCWEGLLK